MKKTIRILWGVLILTIFLKCSLVSVRADEGNVASTVNQFTKCLYDEMLLRKNEIVIEYKGKDYMDIFKSFEKEEFLKKVSALDDPNTSDDFDYLGHNLSYMKTKIKYSKAGDATFTISIQWRETYEQTQYVNTRVDQILNSLEIKDRTNYEKTKKIHDYIVENVEYDSKLQKENAYCALKEGKATCQGYSLLFYKMLTKAGVRCRYITGIGTNDADSGPHGWNIVKLGKSWYNVDATWDDPIYTDMKPNEKKKISYEFFLKGSSEFDKGHKKDADYITPDFVKNYPISVQNFDIDTYVAEYDEEAIPPLVWDLADDPNNLIREENFLTWIEDVATGKINVFTDVADKWNSASVSTKVIVIAFIVVLVLLRVRNKIKLENIDDDSDLY